LLAVPPHERPSLRHDQRAERTAGADFRRDTRVVPLLGERRARILQCVREQSVLAAARRGPHLDTPTGIAIERHIFVGEKSDYYEIEDALPKMTGWD
jgi:hypothetical protein